MATDAVIQFKYSDNVHISAIYKRYDAHPELIVKSLIEYLKQTKNQQWDFIVADIIARFVFETPDRKGVKMLYRPPLKRDKSFIYLWELIPNETDFINTAIPFEKSIHVKVWQKYDNKLLYSGPLCDFKTLDHAD